MRSGLSNGSLRVLRATGSLLRPDADVVRHLRWPVRSVVPVWKPGWQVVPIFSGLRQLGPYYRVETSCAHNSRVGCSHDAA